MKKEMLILFLIGILLISPLILAKEQTQTYSKLNRFTDNAKLFFSSENNKVELALQIREKEVNSAIENSLEGNTEETINNLEKAETKLQLVQEKVSLENVENIKTSVEEIKNKVEEKGLSEEFENYMSQEEKTKLTAELTQKTYDYCAELAKEDFASMLEKEECNPGTAIPGLEEELKELKNIQIKLFVKLMLEIRSCIDDPGTCNCEANLDIEQKAKCEKMVALAMKCEYKEDETSCNELKNMEPKKGDDFAESFIPEFLKNLFKEKEYMIDYDIQPSDCVPEECWDENNKPECRQYDKFKETKEDWDEYGNFIGTRNKCGKEGTTPTMKESIPQCFDGDVFLEEKCGEITMVENEEGLINYIIGKEIDSVIEEFENKSEEHLMEIKSGWMMVDNKWVIDKGQNNENWTMDGNQTGNKVWEIKQEMNQIQNQIVERTFAPGTGPGGNGELVIEGDKIGVVTDDGNRDDGLTPEIREDVAGGSSGGSNNVNDSVDHGPQGIIGNQGYGDGETGDTHEVVDGDGGEGDYAEGTTADESSSE